MQYLKTKNIIYLTILVMIFLAISVIPSFADTQAFNDVLDQLRKDEIIPRVRGQVVSFGNYEDEFAVMEHYQWFPIVNADNFVFSANISWLSSLPATNGSAAGCGVVFGADPLSTDHLMASVRMDSGVNVCQRSKTRHALCPRHLWKCHRTGNNGWDKLSVRYAMHLE